MDCNYVLNKINELHFQTVINTLLIFAVSQSLIFLQYILVPCFELLHAHSNHMNVFLLFFSIWNISLVITTNNNYYQQSIMIRSFREGHNHRRVGEEAITFIEAVKQIIFHIIWGIIIHCVALHKGKPGAHFICAGLISGLRGFRRSQGSFYFSVSEYYYDPDG